LCKNYSKFELHERNVQVLFFSISTTVLAAYQILENDMENARVTIGDTPFNLDLLTNEDAKHHFRFTKDQILELVVALRIQNPFKLSNRVKVPAIEAFCILAKRFAYPNRLNDLAQFFNRPKECLSRCINELIDYLYEKFSILFRFDHRRLTPHLLEYFCEVIHTKAPTTLTFGFIDGTVRSICRPSSFQQQCYNGHKRVHALKYQSITTPDGIIVHLFGPIEGRRHDVFVLAKSGLVHFLKLMLKYKCDQLNVYGDPAYGLRSWLQSPYGGAHIT
jgi:hypothetical protein